MYLFPDDFLDSDGRYRAAMPRDPVPVIYVTAGGSYLCADCANALGPSADETEAHDDTWTPVSYELVYSGPEICCEHCSHAVPPLYGHDDSF